MAGINHPHYPKDLVLSRSERTEVLARSVCEAPIWHLQCTAGLAGLILRQTAAGCGLRYRNLAKMRAVMRLVARRYPGHVVCWDEGLIALATSQLRVRPESEVKRGLQLALTGANQLWVVITPSLDVCVQRWRARSRSGLRRFSDAELREKLRIREEFMTWAVNSSGSVEKGNVCLIRDQDLSEAAQHVCEFLQRNADYHQVGSPVAIG